HPEFGWLAFGGNISKDHDIVRVTPLDSFRSRVYVASLGMWLTLDSGNFERVEMNSRTGEVRVGLAAATPFTPVARLIVEQLARVKAGVYRPKRPFNAERGALVVPLGKEITWV